MVRLRKFLVSFAGDAIAYQKTTKGRRVYAEVHKKLKDANKRSTFVALIETAEGVENAFEIAALKDVDLMWIGHFDLPVSMGMPGEFDHPEFLAAVARVVEACRKHNKSLGRLVPNAAAGTALFREGFDFICHSGDVWMLQQAMQTAVEE